MKAELLTKEDVVVVNLSGRIDMEYSEIFRKACLKEIAGRSEKIIFNFDKLSFVGSNGIMPFVKAIHDLVSQKNAQLRFCQVSSEFQKIFAASPLSGVEIFENERMAIDSFKGPRLPDIIDQEA